MMDESPVPITLLERRTIEAGIAAPLIRAFAEEVGREKALEIVRGVVSKLARESGAELAASVGEATLQAFAKTLGRWSEGGALEIDVLEGNENELSFNVTRCMYAEMYKVLGLADLGSSLSCVRDFELARGFNADITLARTQTIMQGSSHCDFRFKLEKTKCDQEISKS